MEPHPNAFSSMLRTRSIPFSCLPQPLLTLSTRILSSSPSTSSSETRIGYSSINPKSSFNNLSLFSISHSLQTMTISKCFSNSGSSNAIQISESDSVVDSLVVVSFYKFADFPDHAVLRVPLKQLCQELVFCSFLYLYFRNYDYSCRFIVHACKTSIWYLNYLIDELILGFLRIEVLLMFITKTIFLYIFFGFGFSNVI